MSADRPLPPGGTPRQANDLVVVGSGTMGAWTAFHARRAGYRTTLVDAWGAGHPRATSGDETRIMRSSHGTDELYVGWARAALQDWRRFGEEWDEQLFIQTGALWFAHREDGFEAASIDTLGRMGVAIERLDPDEIRARWSQIATEDLAFGAFEPEAGVLMARRGIAAVARAFVAEGGRFELASVRPGRTKGDRLLEVLGADGSRIGGESFVFACGPWLPRLFPELLGDLIRVTKQDVMFIGPAGGDGRFAAEWLPAWVDYDLAFYGIPAIDGRGFKVAPDRYGPVFDPSLGDRMVDPDTARLVRRFLARRFPDLAGQPVVETRVCQYETTPDTHFIIDRHPDYANVWLVGGGSGHGFKHGPTIGAYVVGRLGGEPLGPGEERFSVRAPRMEDAGMRTGGDSIVEDWRGS